MFPRDHLASAELTLSHLIGSKIWKNYSTKNTTAQSKYDPKSEFLSELQFSVDFYQIKPLVKYKKIFCFCRSLT